MERDQLHVVYRDSTGYPANMQPVTDADLREMGYVKRDARWRYCPMCGRKDPTNRQDGDAGLLCLPTNCDAWVFR